MSDVIVTTTNSVTDVTTTDDVTNINITETVVEVSASTAGVQGVPGVNSDPIYVIVTNKTGVTLSKGAIVYTSGANGTHTQVSLANASNDATSARTLGWVVSDILNNADGLVCVEGYIDGINTQGITEGAQLYLSGTVSGGFTATKPQAPTHLVYVGVCSKASAGNGRVLVKVQNGYELDELHNVKIVSPQNNDLLQYVSGTALWENVAASAVSVGSATNAGTATYAVTSGTATYATNSGTATYATTSGTAVSISGSITKSQVSDFTSGTVASASTAQQAGTAVYANTSGTSVYAETSGTSVYATNSGTAVFADNASTATYAVTSGTATYATNSGTSVYADTSDTSVYATNAGTSVYADTSGTATYATTSGTAVSISGTITRSQVSDYASGTVANISGTVTQSQVSNLVTDLAGKAGLADNNTFTGTNTFSNFTTFQAAADTIPIRVFGANGQSADLFSVNDYLTNTQFEILSDGRAQSLKGIIATVSSTASVPLVVRGTAGQSANLTEWQSSTGSTAASLSISSGLFVKGAASGNLIGNFQTNTGTTAVRIFDRSSYADVELIQSTLYTGLQTYIYGAGDYGAALNVVTRSTANAGVIVRGRASQSANLQSWQISDSTETTRVRSGGQIGIGSLITGTTMAINTDTVGGASSKGLVVRGASGQSANAVEIQTSDGTLYTTMTVFGGISSRLSGNYPGVWSVATGDASTKALVVRGHASQSANLTEWQDSSGGTVAYVSSSGFININNASLRVNTGGNTYGARINVATDGVGVIGQVIRAAASQSANLQEWQNSSGGTSASVDASGMANFLRGNFRGAIYGTGTYYGAVNILQESGGHGLVIQGRDSQTTDILRIRVGATPGAGNDALIVQNSSGTTRARIDSGGNIKAANVASLNSFMQITENAGGALQVWAKATAIASNPGTGFASMYFRDGTNAGTLKLVVRAGTAGAETTILDNIPQS